MFVCFFLFLLASTADTSDVARDFFGDIFRMRDCHNGSRCDNGGSRAALEVPGRPCFCQCAPTHLAYREDKQQCIKDIKECYMSVFYRPFTVEAIPLVYLPTSGQLVHPDAHLSLAGRKNSEGGFPTCKAAVSQYLTKDGWRTITKTDGGGPVFGLFTDGNKTFLQFLGSPQDRRLLQQHLALIRLFCRIPHYPPFETCVAIRVGWVPGVDSLEDELPTGKANMMVVGLSLGVLAIVYVFAVVIYLKIRRQQIAKRKIHNDREACIQARDEDPDKATNFKRGEGSKRLELYHTSSTGKKTSENDPWSQIPSLVETYNRPWTAQPGCEFKAQDFQIQPEFFDPEFLASPPQQVLEYLERLQSSVTFARHRLRSCFRYQPTLNGIPEDDYFYQELDKGSPNGTPTKFANMIKEPRTTPDGGSASSMASLLDISDEPEDEELKNVPKVPPKKPKRKAKSNHEPPRNLEQDQKDIQNAMNALNETLDALEYDIYKHDMMHQMSDTEQMSRDSTEEELEGFDTSSSSSLSAVTVLGRDVKKHSDLNSTGSRSVEKNLSEEFSTFCNSTFNVMPGLFARRNNPEDKMPKSDCSDGSKRSNIKRKHFKHNHKFMFRRKLPNDTSLSAAEDDSSVPPITCHESNTREQPQNKSHPLQKSPSIESVTTICTEMTSDSLDSRPSSPHSQGISPTPSLVDMWITKLIQNSVPYSKTRRKAKKKLVLPETDIDSWEHVCHKQKDPQPCPTHTTNHAESNLIDKLANYGSKPTAGQNVAGYFQSLKQDVLKEHLKSWLISNTQNKRHGSGISVKYNTNTDGCPKEPLVSNCCPENGFLCGITPPNPNPTWTTFNKHVTGATAKESMSSIDADSIEQIKNSIGSVSEMVDSLEANVRRSTGFANPVKRNNLS